MGEARIGHAVPMEPETVLGLSDEGVAAVERTTATFTTDDWDRRACGEWTATDLAGHLVCVIAWYHAWLDRAEAGDAAPPFREVDLAERNATALAALSPATGAARVDEFASEARRYAQRLGPVWDLPYGYPTGTVTVGLHAGIAATEWHLHAWDLSGGTHRPSQPRELFVAAATAMTTAQGGAIGRAGAATLPLAARRKPWEQLLKRSGRTQRASG